jgi:hypothetical protein
VSVAGPFVGAAVEESVAADVAVVEVSVAAGVGAFVGAAVEVSVAAGVGAAVEVSVTADVAAVEVSVAADVAVVEVSVAGPFVGAAVEESVAADVAVVEVSVAGPFAVRGAPRLLVEAAAPSTTGLRFRARGAGSACATSSLLVLWNVQCTGLPIGCGAESRPPRCRYSAMAAQTAATADIRRGPVAAR